MQQVPKRVIFEEGKVSLTSNAIEEGIKYGIEYEITDWDPDCNSFNIEDPDDSDNEFSIDFNETYYIKGDCRDFTLIFDEPSLDKRVPSRVMFESGKTEIHSDHREIFLDTEYDIVRYWPEAGLFSIMLEDDEYWQRVDTEVEYVHEYEDFEDDHTGHVTLIYDEVEFYEIW